MMMQVCFIINTCFSQVQMMIDRFHRNNTIGDGELTKADVLKRFAITLQ